MYKPWLPVSHQKQTEKADCLVACAAMVLDYLGHPVDPKRLAQLFGIDPDVGAPASRVRRLTQWGFFVSYGTGAFDDLIHHIEQGHPCIAFVNTLHLSYWPEAIRHAVVVIGMDNQYVYLDDPFFDAAPQRVVRLEFELAWDESDNAFAIITQT